MLAPPWIPVPPPAYGGIESVVALLCEGLVEQGDDVTLFAAPGSRSSAAVAELLPCPHPDRIEAALFESDHVARAFDAIDSAAEAGKPFDVVHDHCGFTSFAMAERIDVPIVHTLHGPFDADTEVFYRDNAGKAHAVALSRYQRDSAPAELGVTDVIPNPIHTADWPFEPDKDDYFLWLGRMADVKGPHRAIAAAREAGVPLVLAGPVQPGQDAFFEEEVAPHVDGERVRYVGEVGGDDKKRLFARARAVLMPIRWAEPFGMVMVEALACGTPVIAFREGSVEDIVIHGETGFLTDDESGMAAAIAELGEIDPAACRAEVLERFEVDVVAAAYERVYRRVASESSSSL